MSFPEFLAFSLVAFFVLLGARIGKENVCLVVFRLGRFHRVTEPGLRWVIPFVDRVTRVEVPDWQELPAGELARRLRDAVDRGEAPPPR
jgi:regulator of protease activity HflC (stomatin/prohibitin superfamily)